MVIILLLLQLLRILKKTWYKKEHEKDEEEPDFMLEAFEWIDANTTPTADTIALHADNYPIIIYELTQKE